MHWCPALCSCVILLDIIEVKTGRTCMNCDKNLWREATLLEATALPSCAAILDRER